MMMCGVENCERQATKAGLCGAHYQRRWKYGNPLGGRQPNDRCIAADCGNKPRSPTAAYCEMHYYRLRRNNSLEPVATATERLDHTAGYKLVYAPGHPLCTARHPHIYEHRKVFYDAYGVGPFSCHVCGKMVTWSDMHVDHLNDVRDDNRIENLAAACETCNPWRGKRAAIAAGTAKSVGLELNGERLTITDWAHRLGIRPANLKRRLVAGWPLERALTEPRGRFGPKAKGV